MTSRADDEKTTSYLHGLEQMFQKQFTQQLDTDQLLQLVDKADPKAAEFLAERLARDDMRGRNGEVTRLLEISTVLVWGMSGKNTFEGVAQPQPDVHTPTEKVYLKRRGRLNRQQISPGVQQAREIRASI